MARKSDYGIWEDPRKPQAKLTYQSEEDFQAEKGEWDFLYGKDDKGYYNLRDGMIIKISGGAAHAVRNG